tara:strand:- start:21912 stop:22631 length:720 start_codon:yes stop_codon:yes gene_type:complete
MIIESQNLKLRIERFTSNFLAKEEIIVFEENKFDLFVGVLFKGFRIKLFPIISFFLKSFIKIMDKFLDIITQHNELKKKIFKQEEVLLKNTKLNLELSSQISELNSKLDKLSIDKNNTSERESVNQSSYQIKSKNWDTSNNEIDFYQKENLRISNELFETKKKFEIMKVELEKFENQRSNMINKINQLNDDINDSNVMTNIFENNLNDKKINVIDTNQIKETKSQIDLSDEISKIFAKK